MPDENWNDLIQSSNLTNLANLATLTNLATSRHATKLKFGTDTHKTYLTNLA